VIGNITGWRSNRCGFIIDSETKVFQLLTDLQVDASGFRGNFMGTRWYIVFVWDTDGSDYYILDRPSGANLRNITDRENSGATAASYV
jgi:hypothetical protein